MHSRLLWVAIFLIFATPGLGAAQEKPARLDAFGDPLPEGALARMATIRFRHFGKSVITLDWSRDGKTIASLGYDNMVRIWELATGKERAVFTGHEKHDWLVALALSPDGKTGASSASNHICLWDAATGKLRRTIDNTHQSLPHQGVKRNARIQALTFSPDGKTLLVALENGSVCRWDVASGKEHPVWKISQDWLWSVAWSPDGKWIAAGDHKGQVYLFSAADDKLVRQWQGIGFLAQGLTFTADSAALIVGGHENDILRVWDVTTGKELEPFRAKDVGSSRLKLSADGKRMVSLDTWASVWDVAARKLLRKFNKVTALNTSGFGGAVLSPDGTKLATCGDVVRLWDVATGKPAGPPHPAHERAIFDLTWSPSGKYLVTIGYEDDAFVWDAASGKLHGRLTGHTSRVAGLAWLPGNKGLITGCWDRTLRVWDCDKLKQIHKGWKAEDAVFKVAVTPDGKTVAAVVGNFGNQQSRVQLLDTGTGAQRLTFGLGGNGLHNGPQQALGVTFLPDGKTLLAAMADRTGVALYGVSNSVAFQRRLDPDDSHPYGVALSADGRMVAVLRPPNVVVIELASGSVCRQFKTNNHLLRGVSFSPNGRLLAVGGTATYNKDKTPPLRVYDLFTGTEVWTPATPQGDLNVVAFAPDGKRLASAGEGVDSILVWDTAHLLSTKPQPLTAKRLQELWTELGASDANTAYTAVLTLAQAPKEAAALIRERLLALAKPGDLELAKRIAKLIADLDAKEFVVREKATVELGQLGAQAEAALRQAAKGPLSEEAERRIGRLLAHMPAKGGDSTAIQVRRALQALEYAGTADARAALAEVLKAQPAPAWSEDARATLQRLEKLQRQ
jgi:WD40 repeat protein